MNITKWGMTVRIDKTELFCAECHQDLTDVDNFTASFGNYYHRTCNPVVKILDQALQATA